MRQLYSCLLIIFTMLLTAGIAKANHVYGADFFYQYISGNIYRVSLVIYGDCSDPTNNFLTLNGASPQVIVNNGGFQQTILTLQQSGPGVEVTPVCTALANSTSCTNISNPLQGVKRYIYTANYAVPYKSADWVFRFAGTMGPTSLAGRSTQIDNILVGSIVTLEALLNNIDSTNSSPQFTTIPTPFYCINVPQQYNQGAVDADHDSLVYALAPGIQGTGIVTYKPGFSATAPLTTATGTFSFSTTTGQMAFTPNVAQRSLVVNQVSEYRHGILVGTASREMTFIVLSTCNNKPATSSIDSINTSGTKGGVPANTSTFNVCTGTDSIHFSIVSYNPANDTLYASVNGLPPGATATIAQDSTTAPIVTVNWKIPAISPGSYNFFVTYKDNGCPLSSQQTQAYTIRVVNPNTMTTTIAAPTQCIHKAFVHYSFANGILPRMVTIKQGAGTISSFTDNTGTMFDSLAAGIYTVTITSPKLDCPTTYSLRVVDSGLYPYIPQVVSPVYFCKYDQALQLQVKPDSGAVIKWYSAAGSSLPGTPTPRTDTTGLFTWYLNQRYKVCESLRDSIKVYVTLRPIASIAAPDEICLNDTAAVSFNGSVGEGPIIDYIWSWDNAGFVSGQNEGPWKIHWYGAGEKIVKLQVAENKCTSLEARKSILVKPVPFAGFNVSGEVCAYDTLRVTYNTKPFDGQVYAWTFDGADTPFADGPGPYILRWDKAGIKHLSLSIDLNGCKDARSIDITVRPLPEAHINNASGPVCIGDKIFLSASGGIKYEWSPQENLFYSPEGILYTQILKPTIYIVKATSEYGCVDSDAINYKVVEPCCNFSYPNAFSPNGDGHNDRFHIVTYGNQLEYELSIYNQWGQRVYYGLEAKEGWDGYFKGKLCDAGAYFYYLNAKCFTGHQETHKGDLILVR